MTNRIILTSSLIEELDKGQWRDAKTPGLVLEVFTSGKRVWKYRRRISKSRQTAKLRLGPFPGHNLSEARKWATTLNRHVERGDNPSDDYRGDQHRRRMSVAQAHELCMKAVGEGRAKRAKRINKPRTIADKVAIFQRDIAPWLGDRLIHKVSERELIELVLQKGRQARVRANRLAAELKVFFGWAASLRGLAVGLETDPSRRLADLRFPEKPCKRRLSLEELVWFLQAVAEEPRDFRRGMLLCLLTAARISEVIHARTDEVREGVWTIPEARSKNSTSHRVALGPWSRVLMASTSEWIFPAVKAKGPRTSGWYKARDRVLIRMTSYAGRPIERSTPHDFRRTARSNTRRLDVDNDTAEAMLNHLKTPLERIYDGYEMEEEKAAGFRTWEAEVVAVARRAGVADKLGVPTELLRSPPGGATRRPTRRKFRRLCLV